MDNSIENKFKWLIVKFSLSTLMFLVSVMFILFGIFLREWVLNVIGIVGLLSSLGLIWLWFILPILVQTISSAKEMAVRDYINSIKEKESKEKI